MRIRELVMVTGWAVAAAADGTVPQRPAVTVRVFDNVGLSRHTLGEAVAEARGIFRRAGVETDWLLCSPSVEAESQDAGCHQGQRQGDVSVGIAPRSMEDRFPISRGAMGMAMPSIGGQPASRAYVFYGRLERLKRLVAYPGPMLMGDIMAHEVGHLLLGPAHTTCGVMRASWDKHVVAEAARGQLAFSGDQAARLQAEVGARAELNAPLLLAAR